MPANVDAGARASAHTATPRAVRCRATRPTVTTASAQTSSCGLAISVAMPSGLTVLGPARREKYNREPATNALAPTATVNTAWVGAPLPRPAGPSGSALSGEIAALGVGGGVRGGSVCGIAPMLSARPAWRRIFGVEMDGSPG